MAESIDNALIKPVIKIFSWCFLLARLELLNEMDDIIAFVALTCYFCSGLF